ncbi:MAG TPA: DUF1656 domain-containing protein [Rhodanobacter sp.]
MIPEIDIYGVYVPTFALVLLGCYVVFRLLHRLLSAGGFYHRVWHRDLFDIATYFALLGGVVLVMEHVFR